MTLVDVEKLKDQLIRHEGDRPTPYLDSKGIWTVGVGHNMNNPLSHQARMQILDDDLSEAISQCIHAFPHFVDLSENRQMVLVNLCFNMGLHRLLGFKKMLTALWQGEYDMAAAEMLDSAWATDVQPSRRDELVALMRGNEMPRVGTE